jgi:predicted Zn-dependent peptidase
MMLRQFFLFFIVCVFLPVAAGASPLRDRVQEYQLDNGLTVLLVERHSSPTVAAYISFRVGAVDETSQQRGIAHMLEHMLFKGTRTLGTLDYAAEKPLLEQIERLGEQIDALKRQPDPDLEQLEELTRLLARLQDEHRELVVKDEFSRLYAEHGGVGYNAFTSKDQTTYLINLPANKLELWAAIESDRLKNAVFREFYTERDVVREERRRVVDINPAGKLYENLLATAFLVHPYRNPIIGWDTDIEQMSLNDIRDFFNSYYAAANMTITLVGSFDSTATMDLIERYFGDLDPGRKTGPVSETEPQQRGERRTHINFAAQPRMMMAFHVPTLPDADDYAFDILTGALTEGRSSRLYQSLVVERQLVTDVGVFRAPGSRYPNLLVISLLPRQGVTLEELEQAVEMELERLIKEPLTAAEIDQARNQILTATLRTMQSNSGLARMLSTYQVLGDWKYLVDYEERIRQVTSEDITRVVKRYLHRDNRTVATLSQGEEQ